MAHPVTDHADLPLRDLLVKLIYWEDPDQAMVVHTTEDGNIMVMDTEWRRIGEGRTLREAMEQRYVTCHCDEDE